MPMRKAGQNGGMSCECGREKSLLIRVNNAGSLIYSYSAVCQMCLSQRVCLSATSGIRRLIIKLLCRFCEEVLPHRQAHWRVTFPQLTLWAFSNCYIF